LKPLYKILSITTDWSTFFSHANDLTKHEKGEIFEKLTELVLLTKPVYKTRYKNVWLLRDGVDSKLRAKLNLPNIDEGIDLIAEAYNGSYCSIQCKFKGANESPTRKDIATFLDLSRNHCKNITEQILVHTGTNGIKKTALLPDSFTQIGLDFWSQLTEDDWLAIQLLVKGKKVTSVKRNPRPHQQEAIAASKQYFLNDKNIRGKLIMPCGTGKSLTAYWITQTLASKATIIAVPSLALIKQSLEDWTKEMVLSKPNELPEWRCICSDESTGQLTDDFVTDTYSLGIPTTTNEDEITSFLKRKTPGGKIIFTTYQSADKLAQVSKRLKFKFDLAILDEAHKTVGAKDKAFSILLQDDKINISKRLFMTATERIVKGAEDEILSMDDDKVYGNVFYKLSFKKAIEDGIITDYKIVTVLVNDTEIQDLIKKNKYLTDRSKKVDEAEAQMLTTAIALKKAIKEYNLKHTVSFHKSINASKEFKSLYEKIDTTADSPTVFHISSKLNAGARAELLKDFKNTSKAIITNARCLTEGVDVPAIDCVLFADQKQSVVDIVQASGRALRQYTDKNTGVKKDFGYIIIPVVLNEGESLDDLTESSRFKTITRIVTSLSTQDETIAEELKQVDAGKQKAGSGKIEVIGSVNKSIKLDLATFTTKINTKIWERVSKLNWMKFSEAKKYVTQNNIKSQSEFRNFIKQEIKPFDLPSAPNIIYKNQGWKSWTDFFENGFIATRLRKYRSFENARLYVKSLGLKNQKEWNALVRSGKLPSDIPGKPTRTYQNLGWLGFGDWLGTGQIANFNKLYKSFEDAREYVRTLGIISVQEWHHIYTKSGKKPTDIPVNPQRSYKKQWVSWSDWLGYEDKSTNKKKDYLDFKKAKKYATSLGLKSYKNWVKYYKENKIPHNIPKSPDVIYKTKGWISWGDWLGTGTIARYYIKYQNFEEARTFVRSLKLDSVKAWHEYCKSGNKPNDIPTNSDKIYKNQGWTSWGDFIGSDYVAHNKRIYLDFKSSREIIQKHKLKSVSDWKKYCESNEKPKDIPNSPDRFYKDKGWISWPDWLGTSK